MHAPRRRAASPLDRTVGMPHARRPIPSEPHETGEVACLRDARAVRDAQGRDGALGIVRDALPKAAALAEVGNLAAAAELLHEAASSIEALNAQADDSSTSTTLGGNQ